MKKKLVMLFTLISVISLMAGCGSEQESTTTEPATEAAGEFADIAGEYAFTESTSMGFDIEWALELKADGNYTLTENNTTLSSANVFGGEFTFDGTTVKTSSLKGISGEYGTPMSPFFDKENGYVSEWSLDGDACEPIGDFGSSLPPLPEGAEAGGELPPLN